MKILMINPDLTRDSGRDLYSGDILTALATFRPHERVYSGFPLALTTLAAVTPSEHQVKIIDEAIEPIDFDEDCDLVGLTAMTFKSPRAFEISREFRKRGKTVILGGIHASMLPEDALKHVDCVVKGEADEIWPQVIEDFSKGQLQPLYRVDKVPDVTKVPVPRYSLIRLEKYFYVYLQTSRGCPYDCSFCTVTKMNGRRMRFKTPEQVVSEIDHVLKHIPYPPLTIIDRMDLRKKKYVTSFFFTDDNFAINRKHAIAVCEAMIRYQEEYKVIFTWVSQVNYEIGLDDELLDLFRRAGCDGLFMGFESLDPKALKAMNKTMNSPDRYVQVFENSRKFGIECVFSVIIGGDYDTSDTVDIITDFINKNRIFYVLPNILTPYPGTNLHKAMAEENRLIAADYAKYNIRNVVYKPKRMSELELQTAYTDLCQRVFEFRNAMSRSKGYLESVHKHYRFRLTMPMRVIALVMFLYSTVSLCFQGRLSFKSLGLVASEATINFIRFGTLIDMVYLGWILDHDAFGRSEQKRLEALKSEFSLYEKTPRAVDGTDDTP